MYTVYFYTGRPLHVYRGMCIGTRSAAYIITSPLFRRSYNDGAPLTVVHGHRGGVVQQKDVGILAVAHDKLLTADGAGRFVRRATDHVFQHVVRGVQVFAFHPAAHVVMINIIVARGPMWAHN